MEILKVLLIFLKAWEIFNALKVFLTKTLVSGKLLMVQLMKKLVKAELKRTE